MTRRLWIIIFVNIIHRISCTRLVGLCEFYQAMSSSHFHTVNKSDGGIRSCEQGRASNRPALDKHHVQDCKLTKMFQDTWFCNILLYMNKNDKPKTNPDSSSDGVNTPAVSLKLSDLIMQPHKVSRAITESYYFMPMQRKWQVLHLDFLGPPPASHYSLSHQ